MSESQTSNLTMCWHSSQPQAMPAYISDEEMELLGKRFQANNICFLLDISFETYLLAHHGWDRIAKHLNDGGGCRVLKGTLVAIEPREGLCAWCERWWSKRSGGLNKTDLCPECARNMQKSRDSLLSYPAQPETGKSETVPAFLEVNHA